MNCIEHYFENLLTMGSDIKGEPNKNSLSKEVQEAVEICADYIKTTKNDLAHNLCKSCKNIGCEFQSGIVRTECAFYMLPHIEPDNCGNYVAQDSTTKKVIRDNRLKNELNGVKNELEPITNNLAVDCISREEAIKTIQRYGVGCFDADEFSPEECERFVIAKLNGLNSITPQKPRKGHWIECMPRGAEEWCYKCSECNFWKYKKTINLSKFSYCPNCGADMREVEE